jgi:hypothetical protein
MRDRIALLIIAMMLLALMMPSHAFARLLFVTPEETIEESDLIVTAIVIKRVEDEQKPVGKFKVTRVLKGGYKREFLTIASEAHFGGMPPGLMQGIPEVGTEVMMILSKNSAGKFDFPELNSVAIIKEGRIIDIYNKGIVENQPYITVYNNLLQKASRQQANTLRGAAAASHVKDKSRTRSTDHFKPLYLGLLASIGGVVIYLFMKRTLGRKGV